MATAPMILMTIDFWWWKLCQLVGIDGIIWISLMQLMKNAAAMLWWVVVCTLINFLQIETMIFVVLFHLIPKWWKEEGPLGREPKMWFGQPWEVISLKGEFGKWWIGASSSVWPIVFYVGSEQAWDRTWKMANLLAGGLSILPESKPHTLALLCPSTVQCIIHHHSSYIHDPLTPPPATTSTTTTTATSRNNNSNNNNNHNHNNNNNNINNHQQQPPQTQTQTTTTTTSTTGHCNQEPATSNN